MNDLNIDFIEQYNHVFDIIEKHPNSKSRNSMRNANRHLKSAWKIRDIDLGMSVFRGITAIEEAATGIIYAMQEIGYDHAEKLSGHDHKHKAAVSMFLKVLETAIFDPSTQGLPKIYIREEQNDNQILIRTAFKFDSLSPDTEWRPNPPLDFAISVDGLLMSFSNHYANVTKNNGYTYFIKYLAKLANKRNRILYATEEGCPEIINIEPRFFSETASEIQNMAIAYLLISQHKEKQQFVQQSLNSILLNIDKLNAENMNPEL
jgi:hypothetical protein